MNQYARFEFLHLAISALTAYRGRSVLTGLGIAIGITAVVLLTSIGEGIHRFVISEFTQFGTNIISISPGKSNTHGVSVGTFGSVRPLTLADANALRDLPNVVSVVPIVQGNAEIEVHNKKRRTTVYGAGSAMAKAFRLNVAIGQFLPDENAETARPFAVLGVRLKEELFGNSPFLGESIRIGGNRYRIIGAMEPKGQVMGFDLDDTVFLPAVRGLELFNRNGLMEIHVQYKENVDANLVVEHVKERMLRLHGREDFTIVTQQQMLNVLDSVLNVLTIAIGALGGVSLLVGAIGILTIMTISVTERIGEIGLLRALGATRRQILLLFLSEAAVLAAIGGIVGLFFGLGAAWLVGVFIPSLPIQTTWYYAVLSEVLAITVGLLAGIAPAYRAAYLDPIEALREE